MSKVVVFINSDNPSISGGRLSFYYLVEAYYRLYNNAVLITYDGESLNLIRDKLTIPMKVINLRMKKQTLKQLEYLIKLMRMNKYDPSIVISNQRVVAGYFYARKKKVKHLYVMHGILIIKSKKQIIDSLFRALFRYTLKRTKFVSVSASPWKQHPNHIGTIYNGVELE